MATSFGISSLRSKFDDWRHGRKQAQSRKAVSPVASPYEAPGNNGELSVLIENLVIPKLIADAGNPAHRISEQGLAEAIDTNRNRPITDEDVATFTTLTMQTEASVLLDFVDNCLATGSSVEALYIDLLAPAARRLGEMWEEDTRDFVDVTMGLWRIQEVMRELSLRVPPPNRPGHGQRSAFFSTMPGEQHSLGTLMIAECFQRAGWDTDVAIEPTLSELTRKVASQSYDLIGLTLSNDCLTDALSDLIHSIRSISNNPEVSIMIGGRFVNANPEIVEQCVLMGPPLMQPPLLRWPISWFRRALKRPALRHK
jgi:methanogenic corrinoid protein MtbC1